MDLQFDQFLLICNGIKHYSTSLFNTPRTKINTMCIYIIKYLGRGVHVTHKVKFLPYLTFQHFNHAEGQMMIKYE